MKRFVKLVLIGFLGVAILFVVAPITQIAALQSRVKHIFTPPKGTTTLCVGDSQIGCTFVQDPAYHNWVFWQSSTPPTFTLMRLKMLEQLDRLKGIQTVITAVGPQTLYFEYQTDQIMWEVWRSSFVWTWRFPEHRHELDVLSDLLSHHLSYKSIRKSTKTINEGAITVDSRFIDRSPEMQAYNVREVLEMHFGDSAAAPNLRAEREAKARADLLELQTFCRERGIRLICVSSPLSESYRNQMPAWAKERFANFQSWLRAEGFEYYDCTTGWPEEAFRDVFHLRYSWAKRFTEWFFTTIVNPPVQTPPPPQLLNSFPERSPPSAKPSQKIEH